MLGDTQRLLSFPFNVINEVTHPLFTFFRIFRRFVDISDFACYMPLPCLMDIHLDPCRSTGRIPVVFSVCFGGKLCTLLTQKQGDGGEVYLFACSQFKVQIKGIAMLIEGDSLLVEVAL